MFCFATSQGLPCPPTVEHVQLVSSYHVRSQQLQQQQQQSLEHQTHHLDPLFASLLMPEPTGDGSLAVPPLPTPHSDSANPLTEQHDQPPLVAPCARDPDACSVPAAPAESLQPSPPMLNPPVVPPPAHQHAAFVAAAALPLMQLPPASSIATADQAAALIPSPLQRLLPGAVAFASGTYGMHAGQPRLEQFMSCPPLANAGSFTLSLCG